MALVCLVLAGISLRLEGGSTFAIGGGFTKWIFWGIVMLTLPQLLGGSTSSDYQFRQRAAALARTGSRECVTTSPRS
jgi:hypothetical protein